MSLFSRRLAASCILGVFGGRVRAALVDYVKPLIGSGGGNGLGSFASSNVHVGAQAPFSFLRLGPDTTWARSDGTVVWVSDDHLAGYSFNDTHVLAFSHTHIQGGGCGDLGNFGVSLSSSPNVSALVVGSATQGDAPYKTPLVHGSGEIASPGTYSLELPGVYPGASVSLIAAGTHSGMHVYECPAPSCTLLIDVCHNTHTGGCPVANLSFASTGNGSSGEWAVNASVLDYGYFAAQGGGVWVHASATLSVMSVGAAQVEQAVAGLWTDRAPLPAAPAGKTPSNDTSGSVGFWVVIPGPARFELRIGISLVSPDGAARNLVAEQRGPAPDSWLRVEELRSRSAAVWEAELGRIQLGVGGADASGDASYAMPAPPQSCPPPNFDPAYVAKVRCACWHASSPFLLAPAVLHRS